MTATSRIVSISGSNSAKNIGSSPSLRFGRRYSARDMRRRSTECVEPPVVSWAFEQRRRAGEMTEGGSATCAASALVNNREAAASRKRCAVRGNGQCAARTARTHGPRAWLEIEWF